MPGVSEIVFASRLIATSLRSASGMMMNAGRMRSCRPRISRDTVIFATRMSYSTTAVKRSNSIGRRTRTCSGQKRAV